MNNEDLEARLMNGGLSRIPPAALMNILRIYMLRLHEFGWMTGELIQNIPHITNEEWPVIFANCTDEHCTTLINLYQRPGRLILNKGTGQATPTRAYQQVLGTIFNDQVRNGGTPPVYRTNGTNGPVPTTNLIGHNGAVSSPQMMQLLK